MPSTNEPRQLVENYAYLSLLSAAGTEIGSRTIAVPDDECSCR